MQDASGTATAVQAPPSQQETSEAPASSNANETTPRNDASEAPASQAQTSENDQGATASAGVSEKIDESSEFILPPNLSPEERAKVIDAMQGIEDRLVKKFKADRLHRVRQQRLQLAAIFGADLTHAVAHDRLIGAAPIEKALADQIANTALTLADATLARHEATFVDVYGA